MNANAMKVVAPSTAPAPTGVETPSTPAPASTPAQASAPAPGPVAVPAATPSPVPTAAPAQAQPSLYQDKQESNGEMKVLLQMLLKQMEQMRFMMQQQMVQQSQFQEGMQQQPQPVMDLGNGQTTNATLRFITQKINSFQSALNIFTEDINVCWLQDVRTSARYAKITGYIMYYDGDNIIC